ncbi:MAG: hypothetical protein ACJAUP_003325 [Cellvibrionaceae bacterium]|jgi:hypothetical protein
MCAADIGQPNMVALYRPRSQIEQSATLISLDNINAVGFEMSNDGQQITCIQSSKGYSLIYLISPYNYLDRIELSSPSSLGGPLSISDIFWSPEARILASWRKLLLWISESYF